MICPKCKSAVRVTDVRNGTDCIVRKRKCINCKKYFYTKEELSNKYEFSKLPDRHKRKGLYKFEKE